MTEPLLSAKDVAAMLGCGVEWVYDAAREGRLPHVRLGRLVRFRRSAIEAWIAEQERKAA